MPTPSSNTHNLLLTVPCSHFIYWFHCGKYPSSIYPSSPTRLKTRFFPQAGHTGCSIFLSYSFLSKKSYIFSESCPSAGYSCLLQPSAHRQNRYPPQGVTILSTVIRWPFEKIVYFNQKANIFRVHSKLYQLTEEIKDRGYKIEKKPMDFLINGFV